MTTLVVQSHPLADSYSAALLDAAVAHVPDARIVRIGQGDRLTAYSFIGVTRLVAIYPTWWGSLPAEMLAALNEVVGPWIDGGEPIATNPLRSIESIAVVTTHGSSKLVNMLQGDPGLLLWKRTLLPLCASGATFSWQALYRMDQISDRERADFIDSITIT